MVRLVRSEGLEGALRTVYAEGVYLTVEEFKGCRPAVRGSTSFAVELGQVRNPLSPERLRQLKHWTAKGASGR